MTQHYSSEGIVLLIKSYSEADKIITVLTPFKGKIRLLAKGARRPSSRKRGHLAEFNKIKLSVSNSKTFDILTEAQLIEDYRDIKLDLKRTSVAYFFVEVINKLTVDNETHQNIYLILENYLTKLQTSNKTKKLRQEFIKEILIELGFWSSDKEMLNPDYALNEVAERQMNSARVGKKLLQ